MATRFDSTDVAAAKRLVSEFKGETDRSCGILCGEWLSANLLTLLRKVMRDLPSDRDLLDGARAPIGTFSARIDLAYALGLINTEMRVDLDLMRKVRNRCAHHIDDSFSFTEEPVKGWVASMTAHRILTDNASLKIAPRTPRLDYELNAGVIQWALQNLVLPRLKPPTDLLQMPWTTTKI